MSFEKTKNNIFYNLHNESEGEQLDERRTRGSSKERKKEKKVWMNEWVNSEPHHMVQLNTAEFSSSERSVGLMSSDGSKGFVTLMDGPERPWGGILFKRWPRPLTIFSKVSEAERFRSHPNDQAFFLVLFFFKAHEPLWLLTHSFKKLGWRRDEMWWRNLHGGSVEDLHHERHEFTQSYFIYVALFIQTEWSTKSSTSPRCQGLDTALETLRVPVKRKREQKRTK